MNISVVIPVYNRPNKIRRALDSVLKQSYSPGEIVVTDDGSSDETAGILEDYHRCHPEVLHVFQHRENRGVSAARNTAIKQASGDWIALLDSDDEWWPHKLERQVEYHRKHRELKVFQCNEVWYRNEVRVNKRDKHQKHSGQFFVHALKLCLVTSSATLVHRSVFQDIGYFDTSFPACEDYDFWLRVLVKYPVGLLDEPLMNRYSGHADQLSSRFWGMDRWRVRAMEKHLNSTLPDEWKEALYRELIAKLEVLHQGAEKRGKPSASAYQRKIIHYTALLRQTESV